MTYLCHAKAQGEFCHCLFFGSSPLVLYAYKPDVMRSPTENTQRKRSYDLSLPDPIFWKRRTLLFTHCCDGKLAGVDFFLVFGLQKVKRVPSPVTRYLSSMIENNPPTLKTPSNSWLRCRGLRRVRIKPSHCLSSQSTGSPFPTRPHPKEG